jgi:hypothetical protein
MVKLAEKVRGFSCRDPHDWKTQEIEGRRIRDRKAVMLTSVQSLRREITARRTPLWTAARIAAFLCRVMWRIRIFHLYGTNQSHRKALILTSVQSLRQKKADCFQSAL